MKLLCRCIVGARLEFGFAVDELGDPDDLPGAFSD
jgi:hypothetical protein